MTFLGKIIALFPGMHMLLVLTSLVHFVMSPGVVSFCLIPSAIYIVPLAVFHLHNKVYPLEEGTFSIVKGYSPWFGTHMIQQNFISFKFAEEILRTIPWSLSAMVTSVGLSGRKQCLYCATFRNC